MTVMTDILDWSNGLPMWIRDALRQLVEGHAPDIAELSAICMEEYGFVAPGILKPVPLEAKHIGGAIGANSDVVLTAIRDIECVNALHAQAQLNFPPTGLMALYGENGSGKTGFARILGNNCRCTSAPGAVLPNVYSKKVGTPTATIDYSKGGIPASFTWSPGACSEDLQAVSFFDSKCAPVYVTRENAVAFAPWGLGLLKNLADVCDQVKSVVQERVKQYPDIAIPMDRAFADTASALWLGNLKGNEKPDKVDAMVAFSKQQVERLNELHTMLTEKDPAKIAKRLTEKNVRFTAALKRSRQIATALGAEACGKVNALLQEQQNAADAEASVREEAFSKAPVPQTGNEAWRILWDAAKAFVVQAYPGSESPADNEIPHCPLCQQVVEGGARERLKAFQVFVQGEASKRLRKARREIATALKDIKGLPLQAPGDDALFSELGGDGESMKAFLARARETVAQLVSVISSGVWDDQPLVSPLIDDFSETLARLIAAGEKSIKGFQDAVDPAKRALLAKEHLELAAKKVLHEHAAQVREKIVNCGVRKALNAAAKSANSGKITLFNNELTDKYVTDEIRTAFTRRIEELFKGRGLVSLEKTQARKGLVYFKVMLSETVQDSPVDTVVSEGEFRAIALAAFLAELDLAPHNSAVVFDDPVSSLDHVRRRTIAQVLVGIANKRQTVVFTHDLYFLAQLLDAARTSKTPVEDVQLLGRGKEFGYVLPQTAFSIKNFKDRAAEIERLAKEAQGFIGAGDILSSDNAARSASTKLRQLTEHAVETVLLGEVVKRFDQALHPNNPALAKKKLLNIKEGDLDLINQLMADYSVYLHDQTPDDQVSPPDPEKILEDLSAIRAWRKDFINR